MNGKIRISGIKIATAIETDDPQEEERCQKIINGAAERLELAIAKVIILEVNTLIPGLIFSYESA